jgi:prepilin-type N-terminal cleavage/methylation domain-containing protein
MAKGESLMGRYLLSLAQRQSIPDAFFGRLVAQPRLTAGFTLTEVLVSILVASTFVAMTMQALVTAAAFRAKADQYDAAVSWIQEDLETVINQASLYEREAIPYPASCSATAASNGLAASFLNDSTRGLGGPTATFGPKTLGGKSYILRRSADFATASDPFKLLKVTYAVAPQAGGSTVATVSTEVILKAVLSCP